MPKQAAYGVIWSPQRFAYEVHTTNVHDSFSIEPGSQTWFAWLDEVSSFTFHSRHGHSCTVRKERVQRGGAYWYGYRRQHRKMVKRYLGRTLDLTLTRLEETAALLTSAEASPSNEEAVQMPRDEWVQDRRHARADTFTIPSVRSGVQPDPLLTTKLHRPRPRSRLVSRSHLVERLEQGMACALTLVSAPAGFGKTTLLAQWLAESNALVAWLSLEPEDNDAVRFLTYLIAALQTVDAHLGTTALELLHTPQPPPPEAIVALLTNNLIRSLAEDITLVLDDYHVITTEPIHLALTFLLDHLPPHLHLVLATRADPPLPLARLRARGHLAEVRAVDLRFSSEEASVFLHTIMGVDLPSEDINALERRTEGWIAGLQLAALALQGRTDVSGFLAAFTGNHRFVLDYLSEEVLSRQPATMQSFLLYTSVLERLNGPLCDAVTQQQGSQAMLEALERANLFVVTLDDERQWYRYHHLFAEVLKKRLQQAESALVPELQRRASTWYEQQGFNLEAVQHALAAPDFERASSLIERHAQEFVQRFDQVHIALGWLNELPEALMHMHPLLCLQQADMLMFTYQFQAAEARLQDVERYLTKDTPLEQARIIQGFAAIIRASIAVALGDLQSTVSLGARALELVPEGETNWRTGAQLHMARAYLLSGDAWPESERLAAAVATTQPNSDNLSLIVKGLCLLARLQVLQGRLHQAAAIYEEARQMALNREGMQALVGSPAYYFGLGDLLREWNDLNTAERFLTQGVELTSSIVQPADDVALGYIALARVQQARGQYSQAVATLDSFLQLARQRHFVPSLLAREAAVRAHLELEQSNLAAAIGWMEASCLSPDDADLSYRHEREYLTLARVRIAQGREDPAGQFLPDALHLLGRLLEDAETKARMGSAMEILILRALALVAQGDRASARTTLERALTLAAPEGYIRLFVDEGTPMQALLRQIHPHVHGSVQGYVSTLLSAFGGQPALPAPRPSLLVEPLTEREREVLRLLLEGASNREIARHLVLSINTVKRHIYNLCGKLGVQSRTQAIVKARALNLM